MKYTEMEKLFYDNNEIEFKLLNLIYVIKSTENGVVIYQKIYSNKKSYYLDFNDAMNSYEVYREPLISYMDRIHIIIDQ